MEYLAEKYKLGDWIVYSPESPIDFGWEFLPTVKDAAQSIAAAETKRKLEHLGSEPLTAGDLWPASLDLFMAAFANALELARAEENWEGDFKGELPRVVWLPTPNYRFTYAFAWKQDQKGKTFIVSPVPMVWLDEHVHDDAKGDLMKAGLRVSRQENGLWHATGRDPQDLKVVATTEQDCWRRLIELDHEGRLAIW